MSQSHITPLYYPLNYIFGLEMDIIVKFYTAEYRTKHHGPVDRKTEAYSPRYTVPKQIAKVLRENGVEVDGSGNGNGDGVNAWAIAEGLYIPLLDYDGEESDTSEWSFCTVKIISPVLEYTHESFIQLECVLGIISEEFDVGVSPSCGLDVHVGINYPDEDESLESKGYPLQTLKNLLQLVGVFWPQLSDIHPPFPMSREEQQFPKDFFLRNMDPLDAAATIESCDSVYGLFKIWETTGDATETGSWVNPLCQISNLLSRAEDNSLEHPTRTVLFRQHQATLDFERVYHWIKLLVRMIRFSHECGPAGLPLSLLLDADQERRTQAGEFDTIAFLKAIGAKRCAKFYQSRLYTHESTPYLNDLEEDDLGDSLGHIDTSSFDYGEEELILTPSDSSSADYEDAVSNIGSSLVPYRGSPAPTCTTDSDMDGSPSSKDESSMSQSLPNSPTSAGAWSHIVEMLKPCSDSDNVLEDVGGDNNSQLWRIFKFQTQLPPDFEDQDGHSIITTGGGCPTFDLTHRKVQY